MENYREEKREPVEKRTNPLPLACASACQAQRIQRNAGEKVGHGWAWVGHLDAVFGNGVTTRKREILDMERTYEMVERDGGKWRYDGKKEKFGHKDT